VAVLLHKNAHNLKLKNPKQETTWSQPSNANGKTSTECKIDRIVDYKFENTLIYCLNSVNIQLMPNNLEVYLNYNFFIIICWL